MPTAPSNGCSCRWTTWSPGWPLSARKVRSRRIQSCKECDTTLINHLSPFLLLPILLYKQPSCPHITFSLPAGNLKSSHSVVVFISLNTFFPLLSIFPSSHCQLSSCCLVAAVCMCVCVDLGVFPENYFDLSHSPDVCSPHYERAAWLVLLPSTLTDGGWAGG